MRNFLATTNEAENIHAPPMWGEIFLRCNVHTVRLHKAVDLFNNTMTNSIGIHTP